VLSFKLLLIIAKLFHGEGSNSRVCRFQSSLTLFAVQALSGALYFPIVLLGATANQLEISIAVCNQASKLLVLDLSLGFHASDNVIRLTRTFKALSCCRVDLRKYYDRVTRLLPPKVSCLYQI